MMAFINGAFQDLEGNPLSNGSLTLQLTKDAQIPGVGQLGAGVIVKVSLDVNGNAPLLGNVVWPNASLIPTDTQYIVIAYSAAGQRVWEGTGTVVFIPPPIVYDVNTSSSVLVHSVRIRFDGDIVNATDNATLSSVAIYAPNSPTMLTGENGNHPFGPRSNVIDASGNLYGENGVSGTQSFQVLNTNTGVQSSGNIINPQYDLSGNITLIGTSPRVRVEVAGTRIYVPLLWGGGILSAPRSSGLVAILQPNLVNAGTVQSVVSPVWASTVPILSQDTLNNIWVLTQSATDNTYWLSRVDTSGTVHGPFNITAFVGTVSSTTPLQYFNDGNGHMLFLMGDGSVQQWSITGDPNITYVQTLTFSGMRTSDTTVLFERLQPNANVIRGGFFISYTNGSGNAAVGLISLSNFSILETYDLSTFRFQDGSSLPIANFQDADYNTTTREFHLALVGKANSWKVTL
jgi:hypothetical protein